MPVEMKMKRCFAIALAIIALLCSCGQKKGTQDKMAEERIPEAEIVVAPEEWVMCFSAKDMRHEGCPWDDASYVVIGGYMSIDTCGTVKGYTLEDNYSSRIQLDSAGILHAHRNSFHEEEKQYTIESMFDLYLLGILEDNPELEGTITYYNAPNSGDAVILYSYPFGASILNGSFSRLDEDTYMSLDTYDRGGGTIVDKIYYKRVKGFLGQ